MSGSVNKMLKSHADASGKKLKDIKRWYQSLPWNKRAEAKNTMFTFRLAAARQQRGG